MERKVSRSHCEISVPAIFYVLINGQMDKDGNWVDIDSIADQRSIFLMFFPGKKKKKREEREGSLDFFPAALLRRRARTKRRRVFWEVWDDEVWLSQKGNSMVAICCTVGTLPSFNRTVHQHTPGYL